MNTRFKNFITEQTSEVDFNIISFIFYEGMIPDPYDPKKVLDHQEWIKKYGDTFKKYYMQYTQDGVMFSFVVPKDVEPRIIHVPDIREFIENDPEGVFTLWTDLVKKLV